MASTKSESDWFIARKGISLLLNNKIEEAEALFTQHPQSFHLKAGQGFVFFMVRVFIKFVKFIFLTFETY